MEWANRELEKHTDYKIEDDFDALFGPMLLCKREVLDTLYSNGFHKVLPKNKDHSMAMERIWGSVLKTEGYEIAGKNSIMGNFFEEIDADTAEEAVKRVEDWNNHHGGSRNLTTAHLDMKNQKGEIIFVFRENQYATKVFMGRT